MKNRRAVASFLLVLIGLPVVLVITDAVSFRTANRNSGTIVSSGRVREYLLHVPPRLDRTKPAPLVISMHGAGGWPAQQMRVSRWNRLADAEGLIVVYPSAVENVGPRIWHVDRGPGLQRDVRFIAELIDTLSKAYNIDPARIYADGLSNGGGMSFVLSCTLSGRIAAVGMVAAARTLPWSWCTDLRPVPMISFHGTADPMIPYDGGPSWMAPDLFPNVRAFTKNWARRNGCDATAADSATASDVTRRLYTHCANDASVVLYTVRGGGHTWPGGEPMAEWFVGTTSNGIDATRELWTFFREHPLR